MGSLDGGLHVLSQELRAVVTDCAASMDRELEQARCLRRTVGCECRRHQRAGGAFTRNAGPSAPGGARSPIKQCITPKDRQQNGRARKNSFEDGLPCRRCYSSCAAGGVDALNCATFLLFCGFLFLLLLGFFVFVSLFV